MRYIGIITLILFLVFGFYTFDRLQNLQREIKQLKSHLAKLEADISSLQTPAESPDEEGAAAVLLYFVHSTPTDFLLVPVTRMVGAGHATPLQALNLLIKGPLPGEQLHHSLPPETKVLSLYIENGLATVDFSQELSTKFVGGSQLESHLVSAIVFTLTQFAEIERVQILLEGEKVESLGGHVNIDNPLP